MSGSQGANAMEPWGVSSRHLRHSLAKPCSLRCTSVSAPAGMFARVEAEMLGMAVGGMPRSAVRGQGKRRHVTMRQASVNARGNLGEWNARLREVPAFKFLIP